MEKNWVMRNKWIFVVGPLALVAFIAIGGEVVMHLWNWLVPALTGWRPITFWQALGLLVLSRILFGRLGGHGPGGGRWRRRWEEKQENLTPEERERFRQGMRSRCGWGAPPATTGSASAETPQ